MILRRIIETLTNEIKTRYEKFVDLFCIPFKLELDQDIWEVCAKFQRASIVRFRQFPREIREREFPREFQEKLERLPSFRRFVNSRVVLNCSVFDRHKIYNFILFKDYSVNVSKI